MIELVISGGQTGADQAGWRAAKAAGIPTGGWMPRGFLTEDGPRPEFAELYGAKEHESPAYPPRTRKNIEQSDGTLIFDTASGMALPDASRGTRAAVKVLMELEKPSVIVGIRLGEPLDLNRPAAIREWLVKCNIHTLNIAGNRESKSPGIGAWVEAYLTEVFRLLREAHWPCSP